MAIDTAAKRRSAASVAGVWNAPGVTPDASKSLAWRQSAGWGYEGIATTAAVVQRQTVLDRAFRPLALQLLNLFGKDVTITYQTPGSYDPSTGLSSATTSAATVRALVERYDVREFGDFIRAGDLKVTTYGIGLTAPDPNDTVTVDSVVYRVVAVESIYSGELAALHEMQVRR